MKLKVLLLLVFLMSLSTTVKAGDVNIVNNIWYDIDLSTKTASVVADPNGGKYTGEVSIPSSIDFDGSVRVTAIGNKAFYNCTNLKKVSMTVQVTSIGEYAFYGCTALEEISGYSKVTTIGKYAFSNCTMLKKFTVYSSLATVELGAFSGCTGLEAVYANTLSIFGNVNYKNNTDGSSNASNPLYYAKRLYVYDSMKAMWYQPTQIDAQSSGTTIKANTFVNSKCHTMNVVSGTTEIASASFRGSEMEELILPSSLTTISSGCFANCANLKRVSCAATTPPTYSGLALSDRLPFKNTDIANATLYVPASSVDAYKQANYWKDFGTITAMPGTVDSKRFGGIYIKLNATGTASIVGYDAANLPPNVHVPDFIAYNGFTYPVTSVRDFAFSGCEMSTLDLPTDITYIGNYAFRNCKNLVEVYMDKAVKTIDGNPFKGCISLQKVRITATTPPSSLNDWENISSADLEVPPSSLSAYSNTTPWSGFNSISQLTGENYWYQGIRYFLNYDLTATVTGFNEEEMDEDIRLLSQIDKDSKTWKVKEVGELAFSSKYFNYSYNTWIYEGSQKLKSVIIPPSVETIGESAFASCKNLINVVLSDGVKYIKIYAFLNCSSLYTINIPNSVTSIEQGAFQYTNITTVTIPQSVSQIGNQPFDSDKLTSIKVASGNTTFDSRNNCNAIIETATNRLVLGCDNTVIPDDVEIIDGAFVNCSLQSVTLPQSVTTLYNGSFQACDQLSSISMGSNVTYIGNLCFDWCTSLTDFYCKAKTPPTLGELVFHKVPLADATLHVPASSINLYKAADQWKDFGNIVALPDEGITTDLETIDNGQMTNDNASDEWYTIDGQKLSGKPTQKGIYIHNGRAVVH